MLLINPRLLGYTLLHAAAFIVFIASLASQLTTAELKSFESFTSSLSSLKSFTKVSSLASVDHCASNLKKLLYSIYIYIYQVSKREARDYFQMFAWPLFRSPI